MDVIQRNFLRLLKSGAFGLPRTDRTHVGMEVEQTLPTVADAEVCPWCFDGMKNCADDFFLKIRSLWKQMQFMGASDRSRDG